MNDARREKVKRMTRIRKKKKDKDDHDKGDVRGRLKSEREGREE